MSWKCADINVFISQSDNFAKSFRVSRLPEAMMAKQKHFWVFSELKKTSCCWHSFLRAFSICRRFVFHDLYHNNLGIFVANDLSYMLSRLSYSGLSCAF